MESRAKLFGHPIHQMLVVFPVGLLGASVFFDLIYMLRDDAQMAVVATYLVATGLVAGLLAAPFGLIDWLGIPRGTRAKRIGAFHAVGNVIVLALFGMAWWLRADAPQAPPALSHALMFMGLGLTLVTAWLGGELIDRLGVGVSDAANLNAPSSLAEPRLPKVRH